MELKRVLDEMVAEGTLYSLPHVIMTTPGPVKTTLYGVLENAEQSSPPLHSGQRNQNARIPRRTRLA
jgi:hypothetical protein